MAVMTSQKTHDPTEQNLTKKHLKSYYKTRPITATLEHPLILDIKLLKKLDMTTFTKKGLIALSKFCGISLITKTDAKRKFNKCLKSNPSKKTNNDVSDGTTLKDITKKDTKGKRKLKQISKPGTRIRFKITEGNVSMDEDSADVVCKTHKVTNNRLTKPHADLKLTEKKSVVNDMMTAAIENIIPEPCKTCRRSEQPERFHSHPKTSTKLNLGQKTNDKNVQVCTHTANNSAKERRKKKMEKNSRADQKASSEESLSPNEETPQNPENNSSGSSTDPLIKKSTPEPDEPKSKSVKKMASEVKLSSEVKSAKKTSGKVGETGKEETQAVEDEEAFRYVTGCYLCGKQVSPKMRMKHEESCILEWRTQNSLLSPDKRKPEPRRPDFRFTESGDLDRQGTFESIWANHKESLVPCRKCGRTFFPDRIEKHENCCNNAPIINKNKN